MDTPIEAVSASPHAAAAQTFVARGTSAYRRISAGMFAAGFCTFSLLYCVQPLLPQFAAEFALGSARSSLALSLTTGFLACSIPAAGSLSARLGRRGLMFLSMLLAALCNVLAGLAPSWHGMLAARALEGLALSGVPAVAMAYLAEEIHPDGLGLSMGLYISGTAFGGMIGRVGMSLLAGWLSWRTGLRLIGSFDLLAALVFLWLLPPSRNYTGRRGLGLGHHLELWRRHLANPGLRLLFITGGLILGVFITLYNYVGFRLLAPPFRLTPAQTGLIFCAYLFGMLASAIAGLLVDRFGRGPILLAAPLLSAAGLALTLPDHLLPVIMGISAMTIGFFVAHTVASGWVGRIAQGAKGHASSLYLLSYYLGSSVFSSWGGWFWQNGGWPWVAGFCGVLLAACCAIALRLALRSE